MKLSDFSYHTAYPWEVLSCKIFPCLDYPGYSALQLSCHLRTVNSQAEQTFEIDFPCETIFVVLESSCA